MAAGRATTLAALLAMLFVAGASPAQSSAQTNVENTATPAELKVLELTNTLRSTHHLAPLTWDPALTRAARLHVAWVLGDPGPLLHQYPGEPDLVTRVSNAGARFETVAENIARRVQSPEDLTRLWMSTPVHRANLLSPDLTSLGIGIVRQDGQLYAVQDFSRSVPSLTPAEIEQHVAALLRERGISSVQTTPDARAACQTNATSSPAALLVVQWDSADLHTLPDVLLDQLAHGRYTSAAIAACPGSNPANRGFTTSHVAVLLYAP